VAEVSGLARPLGIKGQEGILHNRQSRTALLQAPSHRVVFHDTPKHCSWLNQIEIWLSILVRKVLKRGAFVSVERLKTTMLACIAYDNRTMARPFKWTYQGKPLTA
jgi:putative transposase